MGEFRLSESSFSEMKEKLRKKYEEVIERTYKLERRIEETQIGGDNVDHNLFEQLGEARGTAEVLYVWMTEFGINPKPHGGMSVRELKSHVIPEDSKTHSFIDKAGGPIIPELYLVDIDDVHKRVRFRFLLNNILYHMIPTFEQIDLGEVLIQPIGGNNEGIDQ